MHAIRARKCVWCRRGCTGYFSASERGSYGTLVPQTHDPEHQIVRHIRLTYDKIGIKGAPECRIGPGSLSPHDGWTVTTVSKKAIYKYTTGLYAIYNPPSCLYSYVTYNPEVTLFTVLIDDK